MRSARVVSSVTKTTLGCNGARDFWGAGAVVCAQHDRDSIHGNALLAKPMTGAQSTSFNLTIVSFLTYASRNFLTVCNRFHRHDLGPGFFGKRDPLMKFKP